MNWSCKGLLRVHVDPFGLLEVSQYKFSSVVSVGQTFPVTRMCVPEFPFSWVVELTCLFSFAFVVSRHATVGRRSKPRPCVLDLFRKGHGRCSSRVRACNGGRAPIFGSKYALIASESKLSTHSDLGRNLAGTLRKHVACLN